jgi:hypothetical protein
MAKEIAVEQARRLLDEVAQLPSGHPRIGFQLPVEEVSGRSR